MPGMAFAFAAGLGLFRLLPGLSPWAVAALALLLLWLAAHRRPAAWLAGVPLGWLWALGWGAWHELPPVPDAWLRQPVRVPLVVADLPRQGREVSRFVALVEGPDGGRWRVRLSWRHAPRLRPGQRWRASLRLKPAHSFRNEGSWDYAAWLRRQGIRYIGYVRGRDGVQALPPSRCCRLARWRQGLRERLLSVQAPGPGRALLVALVLGDRSGLNTAMRQTFAHTGVSHLLAISGLHISLAGGLVTLLVSLLWRRTRLCRRVPALVAGSLAGLLAATAYALLSGMGLPAQRALLMLGAGVWLLWRRRWRAPWVVFGQVLFVVLLLQPQALDDAGLWLSFGAVAGMLAMLPHLRGRPRWQTWPLVQGAVSLALFPLLLAFDMPLAPVGLLVNLVAVPLFSLVLIPAALLASLLAWLPPGWEAPAAWVSLGLDHVWLALHWLAGLPPLAWHPAWSPTLLCLLALGTLLWLAPPGLPGRGAGLALWLAALLPLPPAIPEGGFRLDVLDVGQGLGCVVRTRHHVLMFDTGARYPSGFNLADAVDVPWLHHQGIGRLDLLILSHGDNDHAGAAGRLLAQVPAARVFSGEPPRLAVPSETCPSRYFWRWDGVLFGFIQPPEARRYRGNNSSCVLLVSGPGGRILITGDAQRRIESRLLPWLRAFHPLDLVVAGHHGSTTSSAPAFVRASGARDVVYSAGFLNRYHFPRPQVDRRWWRAGARRWRTDGCGRIEVDFFAGDGPPPRPRGLAGRKREPGADPAAPCRMTGPPASSMIR